MKTLDTKTIDKLLEKKSTLGKGASSIVYKVFNCFTNKGYLCLKVLNDDLFIGAINETSRKKDDDFDEFGPEEEEDNNNDDFEEEKEIEIDFDKVKQLYNEYELLFHLNHPNILKVYGFYLGDKGHNHNPAILLELCMCNLEEAIKKKVTDVDLISFIYEICAAMKFVHKNHIIHRDLKMRNILITGK